MPDIGDYDQSMRDARLCLVPAHLKTGTVFQERKRGPNGQPFTVVWAKSGTFAVFYRLDLPNGSRKGVRCFLTRVGNEAKQRYAALAKLLPQNLAARTVRFEFHEKGIRVSGKEYPIVEMDFADGRTLIEEVEELCKGNERAALASLAQKWRDLMIKMATVQMAHGDLSGENVIVRSNGRNHELVLIDYDGIYLPDPVLRKFPSSEVGNPNYQHRDIVATSRRQYDERMDDFSGLAIYVALLAFSERPQLFKQFGLTIDGRLLYSQADLANPGTSTVFRELRRCSGEEVRCLVHVLEKACVGSVIDIPRLGWLLENWLQLASPHPQPPKPQSNKGNAIPSATASGPAPHGPSGAASKPNEAVAIWLSLLFALCVVLGIFLANVPMWPGNEAVAILLSLPFLCVVLCVSLLYVSRRRGQELSGPHRPPGSVSKSNEAVVIWLSLLIALGAVLGAFWGSIFLQHAWTEHGQALPGPPSGTLDQSSASQPPMAKPPEAAKPSDASIESGLDIAAPNMLTKALDLARTVSDNYEAARLMEQIATVQIRARDRPAGRLTFQEAIAKAFSLTSNSGKADMLYAISTAQARADDATGAWETFSQAVDADPSYRNLAMKWDALGWIAAAEVKAGHSAGGFTTAERIDNLFWKATAFRQIAEAQTKTGDMEGARKTLEKALAAARADGGNQMFGASQFVQIAMAQEHAGDITDARDTLNEAEALLRPGLHYISNLMTIAIAQVKSGNTVKAQRTVDQAIWACARGDSFNDLHLCYIAEGQAKCGYVTSAQETARLIKDERNKFKALDHIAEAQARAGDVAGASATVQSIGEAPEKVAALCSIAKAQVKFSNIVSSRITCNQALSIARVIGGSTERSNAFAQVLEAQAIAGDMTGIEMTLHALTPLGPSIRSRGYIQVAKGLLVRNGVSFEEE